MTSLASNKKWISTNKDIEKEIITEGNFGEKPVDNSICKIIITNFQVENGPYISDILKSELIDKEQIVILGECDTSVDRKLEKCLETMFENEVSSITIYLTEHLTVIRFNLKLLNLNFQGFFHEWPASTKYSMALQHKVRGVELFKENRHIDAFYRFSKACRLLLTCVLEVDDNESKEIDGINLVDIKTLETVLYGNLASCQLKAQNFEQVIPLCIKVLEKDPENIKCLYKRALAYTFVRDFEKAEQDLVKFLSFEPNNTVMQEKLIYVQQELVKSHKKFVNMCERMFR